MRGLGFALPVTRIPKIVALLAFLMAAGCRDSYPVVLPPDDIFYYPVGLAVRQMPPTLATPAGSSQLVVVSSNFDLRYQESDGGTVLVVDPDASQDSILGGDLAVYPNGFQRIGSFGGQVAVVEQACPPGWPQCPTACSQLSADPAVAAGGAQVLLGSRAIQTLYRMEMAADGSLTCGTGCASVQGVQLLDPYGVATVCNSNGGTDRADGYFTYLRGPSSQGWLTRMDLTTGSVNVLALGISPTYGAAYASLGDWLFISGGASGGLAPLRWINPSVENATSGGYDFPVFNTFVTSGVVLGSSARAVAISNDGLLLFLAVDLYDADLLANTGAYLLEGGALVVFSIARDAYQQPSMALQQVVPTCLGTGDLKVLPPRPGRGDLVALTCDQEGSLVIYDAELGFVTSYIGLDPDTGLPILGRLPFGIAAEPIDPARAITVPASPTAYDPSPCVLGGSCDRLYVGSFLDNWVNILEMDPDRPESIALVKRIGRGP
jgi:hypothetical protein